MNKTPFNSIVGFNRSSESGPDKFAFSIFLKGCNLRCPYCMNCRLVKKNILPPVSLDILEKEIKETKPKMVMISGGEPTCAPIRDIQEIIDWLNSFGCLVGISTNGTNPSVLFDLLPYLKHVTMDLKSNANGYRKISKKDPFFDIVETWKSLRNHKEDGIRLKSSGTFDYEIRTTLYPRLIPSFDTIKELAQLFRKNEKWILQPFRQTKEMLKREAYNVQPYTEDINRKFERIAKLNTEATVELKYV